MNLFFRPQFNYCSLTWMCYSHKTNMKINRLHKDVWELYIIINIQPFIRLLEKDNSVSIHQRNLQKVAIEMIKVSNGLSPVLMNDIFKLRGEQTYNLRELSQFYGPKVYSVYNGTKSVSFLGPLIWDLVPNELKYMKKWSSERCPCRLCKVYISNVGFI